MMLRLQKSAPANKDHIIKGCIPVVPDEDAMPLDEGAVGESAPD
jgi:hypothetical protein